MLLKINNWSSDRCIVSLAKTESAAQDLAEDKINFIKITDESVKLLPDNLDLQMDDKYLDYLAVCNDYDVFEISPDGRMTRVYDDSSADNYFFITGKCNSNCVMCPSSDYSRRNGETETVEQLIEIARHIPTDVNHLTITGGEPFMMGYVLFDFFRFLSEKFTETEFLLLTNGRVLAVSKFTNELKNTFPTKGIVGIPLHGSTSERHDYITRAPGSFSQTCEGIKKLLGIGIPVELRLVVTDLNADDFTEIAELIVSEFSGVRHVCIMAAEMTGNAFRNRAKVWIPYSKAFGKIEEAVRCLIRNGIDVKLYNFPLCTVKPEYWTLCEKSISPGKIRNASCCDLCKISGACGGVFAGTYSLEKDDLRAIK